MAMQIKFGTYTFNSSQDVEAWDETSNSQITPIYEAGLHGASPGTKPVLLDYRTIMIKGTIIKSSQSTLLAELNTLILALNTQPTDAEQPGNPYHQKLWLWDNYYIWAYKKDFKFSYILPGTSLSYEITFFCDNPFWYGSTEINVSPTIQSMWPANSYTVNNVIGEVNAATVYSTITITVTAGTLLSGWVLRNVTTGEQIQINQTISPGGVIILNWESYIFTYNGSSILLKITTDSTINIKLIGGANVFQMWGGGTESPPAGTVNIRFYPRVK